MLCTDKASSIRGDADPAQPEKDGQVLIEQRFPTAERSEKSVGFIETSKQLTLKSQYLSPNKGFKMHLWKPLGCAVSFVTLGKYKQMSIHFQICL